MQFMQTIPMCEPLAGIEFDNRKEKKDEEMHLPLSSLPVSSLRGIKPHHFLSLQLPSLPYFNFRALSLHRKLAVRSRFLTRNHCLGLLIFDLCKRFHPFFIIPFLGSLRVS
ncbi:hypothetical protein VNO77_04885 [Canavalia gladiata]|uniref:Uncharacterized protein n=1 Tax=Canavalia gladiata TaxID=3824 RepID=A0AAN9R9H2_CANGL